MSATVPQGEIAGHASRIVSAVVLGLLALGAAYVGGPLFLLVWAVAALVVLLEWCDVVSAAPRNTALALGGAGLCGTAASLALGSPGPALLSALAGTAAVAICTRPRRWAAAGVIYAAALLVPLVLLREDAQFGFAAVLFLFAVVWATDVAALYVGRYVGGAKLAPRVSPAKTWSGAVGGVLAGVVAGISLLAALRFSFGLTHVLIAFALSIAAQLGDLLESWVKRQFGVKDTSSVIPGHGGLMDRLDGFIAAALLALLLGAARAGPGAPAQGLLQW